MLAMIIIGEICKRGYWRSKILTNTEINVATPINLKATCEYNNDLLLFVGQFFSCVETNHNTNQYLHVCSCMFTGVRLCILYQRTIYKRLALVIAVTFPCKHYPHDYTTCMAGLAQFVVSLVSSIRDTKEYGRPATVLYSFQAPFVHFACMNNLNLSANQSLNSSEFEVIII